MKKKIVTLLMLLCLFVAITGCGESESTKSISEEIVSESKEPILEEIETESSLDTETYVLMDSSFYETFTDFPTSVRNDTTGKWRISKIASDIDITEYAIDYYNTFFIFDDEIHAVVNFTSSTTTKISVLFDGILDVAIFEYVDNEEHDANELFSGKLLKEYWIYLETGEIVEIEHLEKEKPLTEEQAAKEAEEKQLAEEQAAKEATEKQLVEEQAAKEATEKQLAEEGTSNIIVPSDTANSIQNSAGSTPATTTGSGEDSNFNTHNNPDQQNTTMSWVLNTSSKKIHYPSCKSVPKIAPHNYSTSNESVDILRTQGYDTCGNCFK